MTVSVIVRNVSENAELRAAARRRRRTIAHLGLDADFASPAKSNPLAKVNRLTIPVRAFGIGSGVFLLVLVAMLIYQNLNQEQ
jgi:hypothetical protein